MHDSSTAFIAAFIKRTRQLRKARGLTQAKMAIAMGLSVDAYRKYETRSPMPVHLLERFSIITGRGIEFIVTGKPERGSAVEP